MKYKMHVRLLAIFTVLGGLVAGTAITTSIASASVSSSSVSNGPIYYSIQGPNGLKAVNPDGTDATPPTFLGAVPPSFSRDGSLVTWIGFGEGGASVIKVAKVDGSDEISLTSSSSGITYSDPEFSADNSEIIFISSEKKIFSISATTTTATPSNELASSPQDIRGISVSVNDDLAYVAATASCPQGIKVKIGSNTPTDVPNTCGGSAQTTKTTNSLTWNADGTKLFYLYSDFETNTTTIYRSDTDGSNRTQIGTSFATAGYFFSLALSPDGTKIAVAVETEIFGPTDLKVLNSDGTNETVVKSYTPNFKTISWGPSVGGSSGGGDTDSGSGDSTGSGSGSDSTGATPTPTPTENVVPGVTVTDATVYTKAPKKVASNSAVKVMTPEQIKTQRIVSNTPDVCLPNKDNIVFIDEGRCSASILDKKTGEVLRRFRTTVVEDEVSELKVGNEVAILAPIYFDGGSTEVNQKGMKRIRRLQSKITAAGTVLVVGHSGIALGDTEENRILSRQRATSTVAAMKKVGAKGPFFAIGVGGKDPLVTSTSGKDQSKNRRVVIILVP